MPITPKTPDKRDQSNLSFIFFVRDQFMKDMSLRFNFETFLRKYFKNLIKMQDNYSNFSEKLIVFQKKALEECFL